MSKDSTVSPKAVRQFLETDRLFGLTEVPVSATALAAAGRQPTATPSAARSSALSPEEKRKRLTVLDEQQVKGCTNCRLHEGRTQTVFGVGDTNARLVFVGEGPGFEEDRQGIPFVGRAGQLLTRMVAAMGLDRNEVYICNVVKCRPPDNRDPAPDEIAACNPYLREQLTTIEPEVVVALGAPAARTLLATNDSIGRLRGRFHDFEVVAPRGNKFIFPLMPTYHPAYLLRSPNQKGKTWDDLQKVMARLGLPLPSGR